MSSPQTAPVSGAPSPLAALSWAAEFGALLKLGWPLIIAQLAQIALMTTDVIMLGWLGPQFLAASTLANAVFICLQLFGMGLVGAVAPMVAQALGARDFRSVRRTVRQGFWVAIALSLLMFPLLWNVRPILVALGQEPELARLAESFVRAAMWLFPPAFGIIVLRSFLSAHESTRIILLITLCGVVVNAVCNYALIFGNWGFPRLELIGSGISTATVNAVMFALMLAYVLTHKRFRRYHLMARFWKPDWPRFFELLRIGGPIGLMLLAEVALFSIASLLQGWLGTSEVAAHAIALQLASISFMVPLGLSQATTVRVGIAYGEGNLEGIRKAGWTSLGATVIFMALTCLLFLAIPGPLVGLFLDPTNPDNTRTIALAVSYLTVAALFQLFDGAQVSAAAALRGLSDTNAPLIIALVGYWLVGFPIAYVSGIMLGYRGVGIWFGLAGGLAATAAILVIRFALRQRFGLMNKVPA